MEYREETFLRGLGRRRMETTLAESAGIHLTLPFGSFLSCSKNFSLLLSLPSPPQTV